MNLSKSQRQTQNIQFVAGDGSNRKYFRIFYEDGKSDILMKLAPGDLAKFRYEEYDWICISRELNKAGIRAPRFKYMLKESDSLVIEDYGSLTFEKKIQELLAKSELEKVKVFYEKALQKSQKMSALPRLSESIWTKRAFDLKKYLWEADFFERSVLAPLSRNFSLKYSSKLYQAEAHSLANFLPVFSTHFTHRDYHSRNLMVTDSGELAVIDFQDAQLGALSYDMVSLIYDSYVELEFSFRKNLQEYALNHLAWNSKDRETLERSLLPVVLQRSLKAISSFFPPRIGTKKRTLPKLRSKSFTTLKKL